MNIIIKTRALSAPFAGTRIRIRVDDPESPTWGMSDLTIAEDREKAVIDWGDAICEEIAEGGARTHTYARTGEYEVVISDDISGLRCSHLSSASVFRTVYAPMIREVCTSAARLKALENCCFIDATGLTAFTSRQAGIETLAVSAFARCPSLTGRLDLPRVVSIAANSFGGCGAIAELHFGAANEATIKASSAWETSGGRFGAENAEVFFDL